MKIAGRVVLVTDVHLGIGAALVRGLLARGAAKVYAQTEARGRVVPDGAAPILLPTTRRQQFLALARRLTDVTFLVNNVASSGRAAMADVHSDVRPSQSLRSRFDRAEQFIDAFVPVLAPPGGGAIATVLTQSTSYTPWQPEAISPALPTADWPGHAALNVRLEAQGIESLFVHAALVDPGADLPMSSREALAYHMAQRVLDVLERGPRTRVASPLQ